MSFKLIAISFLRCPFISSTSKLSAMTFCPPDILPYAHFCSCKVDKFTYSFENYRSDHTSSPIFLSRRGSSDENEKVVGKFTALNQHLFFDLSIFCINNSFQYNLTWDMYSIQLKPAFISNKGSRHKKIVCSYP